MEERLQGNPVSEGIAYAKSYIYIPGTLTKAPDFFPKGQEEEKYREFRESCEKADSELVTLYNGMCKEDPDKAKIFSAHRELLQDEEILDEIRETICEENMNPDSAVSKVYTEFAELLAGVEDPLIAERAADLRDVRDRLLRILSGQETSKLSSFSEDVILVAHDLLPSDTATMDRKHIKGILTEVGGVNSHSAILARSYGIPAILGVPNVTENSYRYYACHGRFDRRNICHTGRRMYLRYQGKTDIFFPQKRSRKKFFKQTCNYEGRNRNKDRNQYRLAGI